MLLFHQHDTTCCFSSLDVPKNGIVDHCDLIAGHVTWLFILMYKVMCKMSELERVEQTYNLYSSLLTSSCDIIEKITLNKNRMRVIKLARRVTHTGWYIFAHHNSG